MRRRRALVPAALLAAAALSVPAAEAAPARLCELAGPAPDARVVAFDLARPMELALRLSGTSPTVAGGQGWHLAAGFAIFARSDLSRPLAMRLMNVGATPPAVRAAAAGHRAAHVLPAAAVVPFRQDAGTSIPVLPGGRYVAVAFAVDGGSAAPHAQWRAALQGDRPLRCPSTGSAEHYELDERDLDGELLLTTSAAGVARGQQGTLVVRRPHAFGLLAAQATGGVADAVVTRGGHRVAQVEQGIAPFTTGRGTHRMAASWTGLFPRMTLAGVAFDVDKLPPRWS